MKSEGFLQPPQDIMEEYNGCSVPQYTAYRSDRRVIKGCTKGIKKNDFEEEQEPQKIHSRLRLGGVSNRDAE